MSITRTVNYCESQHLFISKIRSCETFCAINYCATCFEKSFEITLRYVLIYTKEDNYHVFVHHVVILPTHSLLANIEKYKDLIYY